MVDDRFAVPITRHDEWTTAVPVEKAQQALLSKIRAMGGRVTTEAANTIEAEFGSRLALRLLGVYLRAGRARLPMKLSIHLAPVDSETCVRLRVASDEGWYLVRFGRLYDAYEAAFGDVVGRLRSA